MKNRIASLFLVFALLMSLCSSAVARDNRITVQSGGAERFTDVPTSHWAYGYINKVVGSGLFNGRTPTTFEPSNAMTRSQFVMVMARMEGRSDLEGVETQTIFPDVATTRRAAGPIAWATEQGFVQGFGDGTFKPDSPINRGQFAALIHRYITAKGYTNLNVVDPEPAQFTDAASVSTAFTADVEYARVHGLLTGYSDGTVRSGNPITRAAIAAILARFLDLVSESKDPATGENYIPLLDYPRSGSDNPTPVDTPSEYAEVKLKVNGGTHGATPTVSVTRNGVAVASGEVQPGDRVTISHKPEAGYVATVRVRDANNRTVSVNRVGSDSSWFYMPSAMPVTVTVTYERESSGGGGGGGGSSSSGTTPSTTYYLKVSSSVNDDNGGWTFVSRTNPVSKSFKVPAKADASREETFTNTSKKVPAFAIFVVNDGYTLTVTDDNDETGEPLDVTLLEDVKDADGNDVYYVILTTTGGSKSKPEEVSVTGVFEKKPGGGSTTSGDEIEVRADAVKITVKAEWDGEAPGEPYSLDEIAQAFVVSSSVSKDGANYAQPGEEVTVNAPQYLGNSVSSANGYFRYQRAAGSATVSATVNNSPNSFTVKPDGNDFTFTVPEGATDEVVFTVEYTVAENKTLQYKFDVKVNDGVENPGEGTVTITPSGYDAQTFEKTTSGVKIPADMTMRDYLEKYPTKDAAEMTWTIPYTISAAPKDENSTFEDLTVSVEPQDNLYEIAPTLGDAASATVNATVSAKFGKVAAAYGYKLTVIGEGTSSFNFQKTEKDGSVTTTPVSVEGFATKPGKDTSGLVIGAIPTFTLTNTPKDATKWKLDSVSVKAGTGTRDGTKITVAENQIADITVAFSKVDAKPVTFTVVSTDGATKVKAENGKIAPIGSASVNEANAKSVLDAATASEATVNSGESQTYYAMGGTIITLTNGGAGKIKSISLSDGGKDIMDTEGYSFALKDVTVFTPGVVTATVQYGTFQSYSLMAAAPVVKDWTPVFPLAWHEIGAIHAYTRNIGTGAKVQDILNSLNDNNATDADTSTTPLENSFTPKLLGSAIAYYVDNAETEDDEKRFEKMLNDSVAEILDKELPSIVKSVAEEKLEAVDGVVDTLLADYPEEKTTIHLPLSHKIDSTTIQNFVDTAFGSVDGYSADKDAYVADTYLTVQMKKLESQLKEALDKFVTLTVQSAEQAADTDSNIVVDVTPISTNINVVPTDAKNNDPATISISADVNGTPGMDYRHDFSYYLGDDFKINVTVNADLYKVDDNGDASLDVDGETVKATKIGVYNDVKTYEELSDLYKAIVGQYNKSHPNDTKEAPDISSQKIKDDADKQAKTQFDSSKESATSNITVDMSQALGEDGATLTKVVYKMLDDALEEVTSRVESLGDAEQTRIAFRNLYGELVQCVGEVDEDKDGDGNIAYLALKTTGSELKPLGTIEEDGSLLLTLDMENFFVGNDTSFEKFVDLLTALRTGFATDVQNNGKKAESVVADLLANRLMGRVKIAKWSDELKDITSDETREVAELLAKLIMSKPDTDTLDGVWTADDSFEAHGYQSVAFTVGFGDGEGAGNKTDLHNALEHVATGATSGLEGGDIRAGFKVDQIIK